MVRTCGLDLTGLGQWSVAGSCEGDNESPPRPVKFSDQWHLLEKTSAPWSYLFSSLQVEKFGYVLQEAPQNWGK